MEPEAKWLLSDKAVVSCTMTGVWHAVEFCKGCAVIFHSPIGCVHVASTMDIGSQYRVFADGGREESDAVPLVSSGMNEKDCIFGGIDKLHRCIEYVMKTYSPECLLIATSCVAGVVGDDAESEAQEAEKTYHVPVLCFPFSGFLGGDYTKGYKETAEALIHRFFKKKDHRPGSVVLLGDEMGPGGQYVREVKRLLSLFHLKASWQFPSFVPFKEWENIPSASYSAVLGSENQNSPMVPVAEELEKDFGVSFLGEVYPIGWEGTKKWIHSWGEMLHRPDLATEVVQEEEKRLQSCVDQISAVTRGKKTVIGVGRGPKWFHPEEMISMVQRMQMDLTHVVFYGNLSADDAAILEKEIQKAAPVDCLRGEKAQQAIDEADVLLTTNQVFTTSTKQFFIPMTPLAGTMGEIAMMKSIYRLLCRYGNKGGIAYAAV